MYHLSLHHQYSMWFIEALQKMVSVSVGKALLIGCLGNRRSCLALLGRCVGGTRNSFWGDLMSPHVTVAIIIGLTWYLFLFQGMLLFLNFIFSGLQCVKQIFQTAEGKRCPPAHQSVLHPRSLFPTAYSTNRRGERRVFMLKESWPGTRSLFPFCI